MARDYCWYEIGTGDLATAYEPLFVGVARIVAPIHHRRIFIPSSNHESKEAPPEGAPFFASGRLSIHPPRNHIQHITTIAQRHAAQQRKVTENHRIAGDVTTHRQIFKNLRYSSNSVTGRAEQ